MVKPRNLRTEDLAYVKELFWLALDRVRVICIQEAMENFAFPDEIKTKLKMYEFMNIFLILTGIPQKKLQKVIFYFH